MLANDISNKYDNLVDCYGTCPGPVATGIAKHAALPARLLGYFCMNILFQTPERGAFHIIRTASKPSQIMKNGTYHWMMYQKPRSEPSLNQNNIQNLNKITEKFVKELEEKY